jgi:hypothetical protein
VAEEDQAELQAQVMARLLEEVNGWRSEVVGRPEPEEG